MSDKIIKLPQIRFAGFTDAWEQRELVDIVEFFSGLTYSPDNVIEDGGTFVLRSSNVKNGEIIDADNVYVESDIVNSDNVQVGDVIVVVRNGSRDLIGKHAQIKKQMNNTVIGAFMTGVRSETPNFTNAMLDTQQFSIEITKNLGATINQITTGAFKKMEFYIPVETAEREQVGTFFAQFDNLITLHQRKLELLKETKKSLLQKMFPKDGANVPEIRFAGFTDVWEQRKLESICGKIRNAFVGVATPYYVEDGHFYLESNNVKDGQINRNKQVFINDEFYKKQKDNWLHTGDLVMVQSGHVGHTAVIPEELDNTAAHALIIFSNYREKVDPYFLNYQFQTHKSKKNLGNITTGNTIKHILASEMKNFQVDIPKYEEQKKIGNFFRQLDDTIILHQRELNSLENLKKSLLQQMFI
ncbi:restriction endonuclease subunit S [Bacillus pumilus]|uniref:restriction endonuclease subunit S n=1 Tax=Bacillus pumilus TaxID=1408 RepID=UPI003D0791A5